MRQKFIGNMSLDGVSELISNRACTHLGAYDSFGPPRAVCIQAEIAGCFCLFFRSQNFKRMNKHLIWLFRVATSSVLVNDLEEGRNVDKRSDCMINHELYQINLCFLFSFLSFKQFMFLYNNTAIDCWIDIAFFFSRSTYMVTSSSYVELMLHLTHTMNKDWFGVFLTSKWIIVLKQRLYVPCPSIFCMDKKFLVIRWIKNENNFFKKRNYLNGAEVCGVIVKILIIFFCCFWTVYWLVMNYIRREKVACRILGMFSTTKPVRFPSLKEQRIWLTSSHLGLTFCQ